MATWASKQWRRLMHRELGSVEKPQDRVEEVKARVDKPHEPADLDALIDALEDPDYSKARGAAKDLGKTGGVRAVGALVRAVEGTDLDVRREAAEALGTIGSAEGVQPLIAALTDTRTHPERHVPLQISASNADARIEAARALGEIGADAARHGVVDGQAINALKSVRHLQLHGLYRGCTLAEAAQEALEKLRTPAEIAGPLPEEAVDVNALIDALTDPDWHKATTAARALGKAGDPQAVHALVQALEGTDLDIRMASASALGKLGSAEAVQPLIVALTDSRTHTQRRSGPDELQQHPTSADARIQAARSLGEIGDPQAIEALNSVKHLQFEAFYLSGTLGEAAEEALAKLGAPADEVAGPISEDRLIEALLSPLSEERERAIDAVEEGGGERSDSLDRAYQASCKMKQAIKSQGLAQQRLVEEAIELAPTFSAAMHLLSNIYQYQHRSTNEALEWATLAVAADTSDWLAWIQLGRVCAHLKRDAVEATRAFAESVRLNPEVEGGLLSEPYSYLLPVYERLHMTEQAIDAENRVRDGGTRISDSYEREWLLAVITAPVEALRDALTGR